MKKLVFLLASLLFTPSLLGFTVTVKTLTQNAYEIKDVTSDMSVADLKAKIMEVSEFVEEDQRLIFAFQELQDLKALSEYNINDDVTIQLVLKLRPAHAGSH